MHASQPWLNSGTVNPTNNNAILVTLSPILRTLQLSYDGPPNPQPGSYPCRLGYSNPLIKQGLKHKQRSRARTGKQLCLQLARPNFEPKRKPETLETPKESQFPNRVPCVCPFDAVLLAQCSPRAALTSLAVWGLGGPTFYHREAGR